MKVQKINFLNSREKRILSKSWDSMNPFIIRALEKLIKDGITQSYYFKPPNKKWKVNIKGDIQKIADLLKYDLTWLDKETVFMTDQFKSEKRRYYCGLI